MAKRCQKCQWWNKMTWYTPDFSINHTTTYTLYTYLCVGQGLRGDLDIIVRWAGDRMQGASAWLTTMRSVERRCEKAQWLGEERLAKRVKSSWLAVHWMERLKERTIHDNPMDGQVKLRSKHWSFTDSVLLIPRLQHVLPYFADANCLRLSESCV